MHVADPADLVAVVGCGRARVRGQRGRQCRCRARHAADPAAAQEQRQRDRPRARPLPAEGRPRADGPGDELAVRHGLLPDHPLHAGRRQGRVRARSAGCAAVGAGMVRRAAADRVDPRRRAGVGRLARARLGVGAEPHGLRARRTLAGQPALRARARGGRRAGRPARLAGRQPHAPAARPDRRAGPFARTRRVRDRRRTRGARTASSRAGDELDGGAPEAGLRRPGRAGRDAAPAGQLRPAHRAVEPHPLHGPARRAAAARGWRGRGRPGAAAPHRPGRHQPGARPRRDRPHDRHRRPGAAGLHRPRRGLFRRAAERCGLRAVPAGRRRRPRDRTGAGRGVARRAAGLRQGGRGVLPAPSRSSAARRSRS